MSDILSAVSGQTALPLVFLGLLGLSLLVYVILDGYDLGVGILLSRAQPAQQDRMVSSIGPFWDANETWLVLGIGLLLTAFPKAHGYILTHLYGPVALMLFGLILRGVSFDFRTKAPAQQKVLWTRAFHAGSVIAAFSQGVMLARYITGFESGALSALFEVVVGLAMLCGYGLLGACWVLMKCDNSLHEQALRWARVSLVGTAVGIALISAVTPLVSQSIFERWFSWPLFAWLSPIPLLTLVLFTALWKALGREPAPGPRSSPFLLACGIFVLSFAGLAVSILPYIVVDKLTVWEAAVSPEALSAIAIGAAIVLPAIVAYTAFVYWIFRGRTDSVEYP